MPSSDGANKGRRETAGLHPRAVSSGAGLTGAPGRPAFGALHSAPVGVQPTTLEGPRPSGPGKAAASSRSALHLRRAASSVPAKRVLTTLGMPPPARSSSRIAGTTAGQRAATPGDRRSTLGGLNSPRQDDVNELPLNPPGGANRRAGGHPFRKKLTVLTACTTPRDSHPQVRATNTYHSGRCEHA